MRVTVKTVYILIFIKNQCHPLKECSENRSLAHSSMKQELELKIFTSERVSSRLSHLIFVSKPIPISF